MGKSGCTKFSEKALIIDSFGRPFEFFLPNGTKRYKTLSGSILTVVTLLIVLLYTAYKYRLLIERE